MAELLPWKVEEPPAPEPEEKKDKGVNNYAVRFPTCNA